MLRKIVGSGVTVLIILTLFLLGPINFKDPAKTLTQTNAWGYSTSHHGGGGGSPYYVPFFGKTIVEETAVPQEEIMSSSTTNQATPASGNETTQTQNNENEGVRTTGAATGILGNGTENSSFFTTIGHFFGNIWSWFTGLF